MADGGPGDVACDVCSDRNCKAVKSCLACLASYCENHLKPHYESPPLKRHKLVEATEYLQEKICSHHDKVMDVYCLNDQQCICYLCMTEEHKGHDIVSAAAERTEKQSKLQQGIQERKKELQDLKEGMQSLQRSAQAAMADSERIFTTLTNSIERSRSELITDQEKVSRAERLLEPLDQEITELRRRDAELEQLSRTEDHIHFLQSCQTLSANSRLGYSPNSSEAVRESVSELKALLGVSKNEVVKIFKTVQDIHAVEPMTREDFLKYSSWLTLDPNTAYKNLRLSEGNREVTYVGQIQSYPDHLDRFEHKVQVLCREGLSGRCYWEAEWSGDRVIIAVSYKEISRKGEVDDCALGKNNKSWSLRRLDSSYYFWHSNESTKIPVPPSSSRIGVYLDHRARTLSFYSVSDTMTLLYRVQTTFTQPLYPGFGFNSFNSSVKLCDLA